MPFVLPRRRRLRSRGRIACRLLALGLLLAVVAGCGQQIGSSPEPTAADFPGVAGFLGRHGISLAQIASGDAGCADPELARTAIRFSGSGLDQQAPILLRIYIFRDRAAYDRRRLSVDACARSWITDPDQLISIDASPFVVIGQGPVGPQFIAALRQGLREAAALP